MKKPNILLVLLDGCRADRLGCYGYKVRQTSPTIDKLAEEGLIALNHYSTSNCTMPAVVSMMTGLYPCVHKASSTFSYYDGAYPFLTEILQENGYYTFGITNNLVSMSPEWGFVRGYDKYYRIGKTQDWFKESKEEQRGVKKVSLKTKIKRLILKSIDLVLPFLKKKIERNIQLKYYKSQDMGGSKAVQTMELALKNRDQEKPFFGYINLPDTHHPYFVPANPLSSELKLTEISDTLLTLNTNPSKIYFENAKLTDEDKNDLDVMYDQCVSYSDVLVSKLYSILEESNLLENTVLVFCADHGGMLCEKEMLFASTAFSYEPEIKVPLIIWGKGIEHKRLKSLTSAIDIFPTILKIADVEIKYNVHGKSILSKDLGHDEVLIDYPCYPEWSRDHLKGINLINFALFSKVNRTMVTADGYKIIWTSNKNPESYRLSKDKDEKENIFNECGQSLLIRMKQKYGIISNNEDFSYYPFSDIGPNGSNIKLKKPSINKSVVII